MMIKEFLSIGSIKTYSRRTSKDLVCKKEEIKCNNTRSIRSKIPIVN